MLNAEDLIDLDRYPIGRSGPGRDGVVDSVRGQLAEDGCAVLRGFLTAKGVQAIRSEADSVAAVGIAFIVASASQPMQR